MNSAHCMPSACNGDGSVGGVVVDVGAVPVSVEDHDEFGGTVERSDGVRGHGGELGGLAGFHDDDSFAEQQLHTSAENEEPVVPRVHLLLAGGAGFKADFTATVLPVGRLSIQVVRWFEVLASGWMTTSSSLWTFSSVSTSICSALANGTKMSRLMVRLPVSTRLIVDALRLVRAASSSSESPSVWRRLRSRVRTTCSMLVGSFNGPPPKDLANTARRYAFCDAQPSMLP